MSHILQGVFTTSELAIATEMAEANRKKLGPKYDTYINRVTHVLKSSFPETSKISDEVLFEIVAMIDLVELESISIMERYKTACVRCGWCCTQTKSIIVSPKDVKRISKKLHKKREELFVFGVKDWQIKNSRPCQWWNPNNGLCLIYKNRPSVCRSWPLGTDDNGRKILHPVSECNYSTTVLANKVIGALRVAGQIP
jgi:Fe-S-cluster containining protein